MAMQVEIQPRRAGTGKPESPERLELDPAGLHPAGPLAKVRDRRIRVALALIASRPACAVRELALAVRLSPSRFQRLFKQEMGLAVRDFLNEQRLRQAADLLSANSLSIKEVAYAVGYEHHSSFTRAFENLFGQPPKRYREQCELSAKPPSRPPQTISLPAAILQEEAPNAKKC